MPERVAPNDLVILVDKREKNPLVFPSTMLVSTGWTRHLFKVITKPQTLKTGDYAVEGFEDICLVERKGSMEELQSNFFGQRDSWRFRRCLERLRDSTKHPVLLFDIALASAFRATEFSKNPSDVLDAALRACIRYNVTPLWLTPPVAAAWASRTGEFVARMMWACIYEEVFRDRRADRTGLAGGTGLPGRPNGLAEEPLPDMPQEVLPGGPGLQDETLP